MMAASKTGLPMYTRRHGVGQVFAAQIREVLPFTQPGAKTLLFSNSPKRVNLIREWVRANNPSVGGYFVVEDDEAANTICRFVHQAEFEEQFAEAAP